MAASRGSTTRSLPVRVAIRPVIAGLALSGLIALLLVASVVVIPGWLVQADTAGAVLAPAELAKARNDVRTTLLQGLAGITLIVGAYLTWRRLQVDKGVAESKLDSDRDGALTERFIQAVDQLGDDKMPVRLGGIHALARIAESPTVDLRDRAAVLEILSAVVRRPPYEGIPDETIVTDISHLPIRAPDTQEALSAITRIAPAEPWTRGWWVVNLTGTDLRRAWLSGANLRRFGLRYANLEKASLDGADLRGTELRGANLRSANLDGAVADPTTWWPDDFDPMAAGVHIVDLDPTIDVSECDAPGLRTS